MGTREVKVRPAEDLSMAIDYEALDRLMEKEINRSLAKGSRVALFFIAILAIGLGLISIMKPQFHLWMPCIMLLLIDVYIFYVLSLSSKGAIPMARAPMVLLPLILVNFFMFAAAWLFAPVVMWQSVVGPGAFACFIIIIMTGFVFNARFSRITGILVGTLYFLTFLMMRDRLLAMVIPDPLYADIMAAPMQFAFKSLIMVFAGYQTGALSDTTRRLLSSIIKEEQEKSFISSAFGMIMDPRVKEEIMSGKVEFGGEVRMVTVLFADIRGFTSFSEKMPPRELLHFMKEYFDLMNGEIGKAEGTIMEYVGDEVMVLFGAPLPQEQHAIKACRAAQMMIEALERQRPLWQKEGKPAVRIGVGVHTGTMLVGNIGSSQRFKYGALGDNVNLGSRLQGLTKTYGVDIIASESTVETAESRFHTRELDRVSVKGREKEITIYEIVAPSYKKLTPEKEKLLSAYREGHAAFQRGDREKALSCFIECLETDPADGPSKYYLEKLNKGME